jgi:hypothetical protein
MRIRIHNTYPDPHTLLKRMSTENSLSTIRSGQLKPCPLKKIWAKENETWEAQRFCLKSVESDPKAYITIHIFLIASAGLLTSDLETDLQS